MESGNIAAEIIKLSGLGENAEDRSKKLIKVDGEASVAYALFRLKKWEPSRYYSMGAGERLVTRAFLKQELQDIEKEVKHNGR